MNWKKAAEDDLRRYTAQKQSLQNIPERIQALQYSCTALKGSTCCSDPVQGGMSQMEDRLLDNIVSRERLKHTYKATQRLVQLVERGLVGLEEHERNVLDVFYMHRCKGHVEKLMEEFNYEKSQVYRIKDTALYKFTIAMYGLVDY